SFSTVPWKPWSGAWMRPPASVSGPVSILPPARFSWPASPPPLLAVWSSSRSCRKNCLGRVRPSLKLPQGTPARSVSEGPEDSSLTLRAGVASVACGRTKCSHPTIYLHLLYNQLSIFPSFLWSTPDETCPRLAVRQRFRLDRQSQETSRHSKHQHRRRAPEGARP